MIQGAIAPPNKKTNPSSGWSFFAYSRVFARVRAGSCGLRGFPRAPGFGRLHSLLAILLSGLGVRGWPEVRKADKFSRSQSSYYLWTLQRGFLWHWVAKGTSLLDGAGHQRTAKRRSVLADADGCGRLGTTWQSFTPPLYLMIPLAFRLDRVSAGRSGRSALPPMSMFMAKIQVTPGLSMYPTYHPICGVDRAAHPVLARRL